jgi:hypothetical protein
MAREGSGRVGVTSPSWEWLAIACAVEAMERCGGGAEMLAKRARGELFRGATKRGTNGGSSHVSRLLLRHCDGCPIQRAARVRPPSECYVSPRNVERCDCAHAAISSD